MSGQQLLDRLHNLTEKARQASTVIPDETGRFSVEDDLVRTTRSLIGEAVDLLRDLASHYDALGGPEEEAAPMADGETLEGIGAQISTELAAREVADLAFISRNQLSEEQENLEKAIRDKQLWAVASYASSGLRRAGKALVALNTAVSEVEGAAGPSKPWVDLEDSLATRRVYGQFRRGVLRHADDDDLGHRLKTAAQRIAILRKLEIYPFLRIDDRVAIKQLSRRIQAWMDAGGSDTEGGARLWQDLVSFARLLAKVNEREELREHDRRQVHLLKKHLFEGPAPVNRLSSTQLEDLARLEGLDDTIDAFLKQPSAAGIPSLHEPLERISQSFASRRSSLPDLEN